MGEMKTLEQMGEHAAIAALTANLKAVGDDCAVLPMNETHDLVLTSDPLIENVHFTPNATPEQVAHKAVCRVLSDFAAMGAEPHYLLVNLVAPPQQNFQTLEKIYAGFSKLWKTYGAEVVGGDLAQGPVLELHVFGVGRVPKGTALLRSGAKPGDHIYVTGPLGGAQKSGKQFRFEPRLEWGNALRESGTVTSMMDISDGLATDLRHILKASGVGAELDSSKVPTFATRSEAGAKRRPRSGNASAGEPVAGKIGNALYDGEDFELLFTAPPDAVFQGLEKKFPSIGKITERSNELLLDGEPLTEKAFEHFKG